MLIQNIQADKHFPDTLEGKVFFPLFNKEITVQGFTTETIAYAEECARLLTELSEPLISQLCQASIRYCNTFLEEVGEETTQFEHERDVLALIYPSCLITDDARPQPVIHLELNCEWEQEHGMEWVVRDNEVKYVSAFNGVSAYSDFTEDDDWNFAKM